MRELDAQIAREVFGLTVRPVKVLDGRGEHDDIGIVEAPRTMSDGRIGVAAQAIPHYSTSIEDAWAVWERVANDKPWAIETWSGGARVFAYEFDSYEKTIAEADTAPLAICLAALKALEGSGG